MSVDSEVNALYTQALQQKDLRLANGFLLQHARPNKNALPGGYLYQRFCNARVATNKSAMCIVYHGTPRTNVPAILEQGLLEKFRVRQAKGRGEYFAFQPANAAPYCLSQSRQTDIIMFLVLVAQSGVTHRDSQILVVHKASHQLPIAVLTFGPR